MAGIGSSRTLRSHLYVPADNDGMVAKAGARGADAVILDLEDAVAPARKDEARRSVLAAAPELSTRTQVWVRVNEGERGMRDIEHLAGADGVAGIWLAKAEPGDWLEQALALLVERSTRSGLLLESARSLARLAELPELPADTLVQIGEVDLVADLGGERVPEQLEVFRAMVVLECAVRGVAAPLAPASVDVGDMESFRTESSALRARGFCGRACVHPAQVAVTNEVWGVTDAELARAREILREFEAREAEGVGAFRAEDGTMVDRATVRWARRILADQGW